MRIYALPIDEKHQTIEGSPLCEIVITPLDEPDGNFDYVYRKGFYVKAGNHRFKTKIDVDIPRRRLTIKTDKKYFLELPLQTPPPDVPKNASDILDALEAWKNSGQTTLSFGGFVIEIDSVYNGLEIYQTGNYAVEMECEGNTFTLA